MSRSPDPDRLDSWKAIARYLGRSVRTVRRWEQLEGLPIHRLMHRSQASVYAYPRELDAWRDGRARGPGSPSEAVPPLRQPRTDSERRRARQAPETVAAIAVLPFTFAGPDPAQAWVADGLAEEMISGFSRLSDLRVTSRTSSAAFTGGDRDSGAIARLLGVNYLLEGGVLGDGRRLRISVRLIDPERDDHLWSPLHR